VARVIEITDPAEAWLVLGQHHPGPACCRSLRGCEAARPATNHQHVAIDADLFVGGGNRARSERDRARQRGGSAVHTDDARSSWAT
jgi:hypothetical protein